MRANTMHRMCLRKRRFRDERAALRVVHRAAAEGVTLRAYWCPLCSGFHITKAELRASAGKDRP